MVAGVDGADFTIREMLIRMEGTVDRTAIDVAAMRSNHERLAERVGKLEGDKHYERGQKHGFERGVRVIYALATVTGLGGIAAALKILFPLTGAH